ncbi:SDR family NAD(P)-dependent oxidoreductase [Clostridium sp. JN-1]|uniref:dTDP-glucose 4,6-dehydratase n=1 Tax=Clostridium sp. JN-1 TaxID=2483110 RepID=UPI000F0B427C|nr:SDR family NAD(P)-dependent oxidoreductase [Clostridium sp. JN-1]
MNMLVTGGAGFIGRWVVKKLLDDGHKVVAFDNLSNGRLENIKEFKGSDNFKFIGGDIRDRNKLDEVFKEKFDIIYHLASSIDVQDSIDDPETTFNNDTVGTFNILERAKTQMFGKNGRLSGDEWILDSMEDTYPCKVVFISTCTVYSAAEDKKLDEKCPVKPLSPYVGSKIAAENMVLSYFNAYKLPAVVVRPFNTYGPFQKANGEGGVVAIFISNLLRGRNINIYGSGEQTRDLLYVKDCVKFIAMAGYSERANGEIINVGTGKDVTINKLAEVITKNKVKIKHTKHNHPHGEIMRLRCNYDKAKNLINWEPEYTLERGIEESKEWMKGTFLITPGV